MGNQPSGLFAIDGPLNKMQIPYRFNFHYCELMDSTEPYYEKDAKNLATDENYRENFIPLNVEEIKLVRRILPYDVNASKLRLKMYVEDRETDLENNLNETKRLNNTARGNLNAVYFEYIDVLKIYTDLKKEIIPLKLQDEYYKTYNKSLDKIVNEVGEKFKELKI